MARVQAFDWAEIIPNIRRFVDKCCAGKHKKQYRRHAHRFAESKIQTHCSLHSSIVKNHLHFIRIHLHSSEIDGMIHAFSHHSQGKEN